jgi:hypothetical protein
MLAIFDVSLNSSLNQAGLGQVQSELVRNPGRLASELRKLKP